MDVEGQRSIYHKGMVTDTHILVLHHFHNYRHMIQELSAKNYLHQDHQQQTIITSGSRVDVCMPHNITGFCTIMEEHAASNFRPMNLVQTDAEPSNIWTLTL